MPCLGRAKLPRSGLLARGLHAQDCLLQPQIWVVGPHTTVGSFCPTLGRNHGAHSPSPNAVDPPATPSSTSATRPRLPPPPSSPACSVARALPRERSLYFQLNPSSMSSAPSSQIHLRPCTEEEERDREAGPICHFLSE